MEPITENRTSTFVTVLAWLMIIAGGFGVYMGTWQSVLFFAFFPEFPAAPDQSPVFKYFQYFPILFVVIFFVVLAAGVGLLRRRSWARTTSIVLFLLGIAWTLFSIVWVFLLMPDAPLPPEGAPPEYVRLSEQMASFRLGTELFMLTTAVIVAGIFIWLVRQLMSPEIRGEFTI